jgi:4-aminobutyrate aminotransferase/(S)-3-amino-2-methylpropionate transaminase
MPTIHLLTEVPGPKSQAIVARRVAATPQGAAKLTNIAIAHAQGAALTDVDGNTFLDFAGGIGMLAVGHCPPELVAAIQAQAAAYINPCAIVLSHEPYVRVAELLNEVTPGTFPKKTVLLNSGAEAVETAVKIARAYTKRNAVVVFENAYHGRTNLTLAMTSKYGLFKKGFGPFAPEIYRIPFPNLYRRPAGLAEADFIDYAIQQLENAFIAYVDPKDVACVVIEPVQGEGGFLPTPAAFLQRLRALCDQHGMLLVADEIQCGFGRTGKLFACEHSNVVPDLITTGKSLAAGMPLAAVSGRADVMDAPHPGGLGGTYSGNPLACVAACYAIEQIRQPEFLARAQAIGEQLRQALNALQAQYPAIGDVRGVGPMLAMEIVRDPLSKTPAPEKVVELTQAALTRGLITLRAGLYSNCLRLLPPLNISDAQVAEAVDVLQQACAAVFA